MAQANRRKNRRTATRVSVIYVHDGDFLTSHSKDLSPDGMFVYTHDPPPIGTTTEIHFSLGKIDDLTIKARVIWVNRSALETESGMGVQFVDPPPFFKQNILEAVKRVAFLGENGDTAKKH